jgi:ABC-2 type transport system ATP-binding protein
VLEANLLHIGYNAPLLLKPIDGSWSMGEIVVILGDNGVGKSTFLKTLANLQKPISGKVKRSTNRLGWVDSSILKGVYLSVNDFLGFGIEFNEEELNRWLNQFEINIDLSSFVDEISDGQFRKLCIIRQLLKKPKILFLDEPTVYLDVKSKKQLAIIIKELKEECLIFCSTHDLHFANEIKTSTIEF